MDNRQNLEKVRKLLELSLLTVIVSQVHKLNVKRKRRWWVRPLYEKRYRLGFYNNLIQEMRLSDCEMFFNFTRMSVHSFDKLLNLVGPLITKNSHREPIPAGCRLALTLRYENCNKDIPF